ncbi:hypothetical protein [Mycobacteroides abscessus]|uniref:hypothetical protein n=1 Tax=Mycobacteroides abscessus TaxID=36809 RepID=UPI0009C798AA|nr:hypothetical protein [Mycobacteroides abscessus]SKF91071.1 bacteriophage membrane protein [Mycobacteroides abscessus subsp. bolletii]SKG26247.1 bacteriophage membrane protein [Mycobacteroides abscessus subsp. bolletii]SKH28487.1 bacteriophage membrane protein [Mycobacteroides abscessus subsp. bolletii]SKH58698.1 bacteriophage membrane protein [Mycobacteroides abscessus subsp. bolletii]SKH89916.1 bacteriophage membrane protein [Mycobacteroides abscessus subsp. bolletii]
MPASFDFGPPPAITHNPAQRLDPSLPRLPKFSPLQIFQQWIQGIKEATGLDLSGPVAFIASLGGLLQSAVGKLFNGVLPAAWIADIAQDLIDGAGGFTDPSVVEDNPYWHYDALQNGHLSGKSLYVNANGNAYAISVKDPFDVAPGQTIDMAASAMWQGLSAAAGSNPIRLCITPFAPDGTKLPDVVVKQLQPMAADSSWVRASLTGSWTVPANGSVKSATVTLVVTEGATAGRVHFSNVTSVMSNLGPVLGKFRSFFDTIGGQANSDIAQFEQRFAAITADGKITASEVWGLLGLGNIPTLPQTKVTDLPDLNAQLNQIRDIFAGLVVTPINSTIQAVKDWFGLTQNKTQALNGSGQLAGSAITGAISEAQTGLNAVRDAIANGLGAVGSGFTNLQAQNQAIQVAQIAAQAAAAAAAANAQLAKSQGQQNAAGGGLNYTTVFGGADGAALPAEFTGSDLKVRGNNGYAGIAASEPDGTYVVTCNKQCTTDDQSLAVVLGDQGGSASAPEYHLFHSDSGYTAGACLKIDNGNATIGSYTRSGATINFTAFPGGTWSGALGQGSLVEVHNVGTTWTLAINGNTVLSVTSSAVTFGASTRYGGGVVMVRATVNLGWFQGTVTYDSFRVASITLSDYIDPIYLGSGATMARTSATNVTIATGTTVLPNSFYSVVQSSTPDIECNLTNGTMKVSLSGWYLAKLSTKSNIFTNSTNSAGQANPAIFVNSTTTPSKLGLPQQYSRSNSSDGSVDLTIPVLSLSDSFVIYLNAGDVVRGGQVLGSNASTRQVTGDSAGTATCLSLALLNRSQI